jgi:hypothetical protein
MPAGTLTGTQLLAWAPWPHHLLASQGLAKTAGAWVQPPLAEQASTLHGLPSLQSKLAPALQVPLSQASALHLLPSRSQGPGAAMCWQLPPEQPSKVQGFASSHGLSLPVHTPVWHASLALHGLPSSQPLPSATLTAKHAPEAGSHLGTTQALALGQAFSWPGLHLPEVHRSALVQALPSSQGLPSSGKYTQPMVLLQVSWVQESPSLHATGVWPQPALALQSSWVQASPSSQELLTICAPHTPAVQTRALSVSSAPSLKHSASPQGFPSKALKVWHFPEMQRAYSQLVSAPDAEQSPSPLQEEAASAAAVVSSPRSEAASCAWPVSLASPGNPLLSPLSPSPFPSWPSAELSGGISVGSGVHPCNAAALARTAIA